MTVILTTAFLCVTASAVSVDGDGAAPTRAVRVLGDTPVGYQPPPPPVPTDGEPPQIVKITGGADGGAPVEPRPLWGLDATVYSGNLKYITPYKSERMIAYDQTGDGVLFAAFTVPNGDTAHIYRSTDGGNNWTYWNGIRHTGNVWSSSLSLRRETRTSFSSSPRARPATATSMWAAGR